MDIGSDKKFITLQEAAKFCEYSQDYLSLRARQGKLKAVKLDRNWSTTLEWLYAYIKKTKEYNDSIESKKNISTAKTKFVEPPINLPIEIEEIPNIPSLEILQTNSLADILEMRKAVSAFAAILLLFGFTIASHKEIFMDVSYFVYTAVQNTANSAIALNIDMNQESVLEPSAIDTRNVHASWLRGSLSELGGGVMRGVYTVHESISRTARSFGEQLGGRFLGSKDPAWQVELIDQETGNVYCVWLEVGEFVKVPGNCTNGNSQNKAPFDPGLLHED